MQQHLALVTFEYQDQQKVRTVLVNNEPWFYLGDLCRVLELNLSEGREALDSDQVDTTEVLDSLGRKQKTDIVCESGMYTLILRSGTKDAKSFRRWVSNEVLPQIRKTGGFSLLPNRIPSFVRRFNDNWSRVSPGYFSVISELFIRVYGKFEQVGYTLRDKATTGSEIRPDVSVGKLFSSWLKKYHPLSVPRRKNYLHLLPNGQEVEAYQYPMDMLPMFIEFVETVWLPDHAPKYLSSRDPAALPYIPKILPPSAPTKMFAE